MRADKENGHSLNRDNIPLLSIANKGGGGLPGEEQICKTGRRTKLYHLENSPGLNCNVLLLGEGGETAG